MKHLITFFTTAILLLAATMSAQAQKKDRFWTPVSESEVIAAAQNRSRDAAPLPKVFKAFRLDTAAMRAELRKAPLYNFGGKNPHSACVVTLPTASGEMEEFEVYETTLMEAELADKYPQIKSYIGFLLKGAGGRVRFCLSPEGISSTLWSQNAGIGILENFNSNDVCQTLCYTRNQIVDKSVFSCNTIGKSLSPSTPSVMTQTIYREYRLALACTGEYARKLGGTKAKVMAGFGKSLTRINGVYEKELAIHFNLCAKNDTLIFLNKNTDPFTNDSSDLLLNENQILIDNRIKTANYDIGHVFSTGGGGRAALGSVCNNDSKARGETGSSTPYGDGFDIDFVCHEIGHQFGANHTFSEARNKNTDDNCTLNYNLPTAVELSSGTTIMGYAGVCDHNLQLHSEDYFNITSINEIRNILDTTTCSQDIITGNIAPKIISAVGSDFYIPAQTPFVLKGEAIDDNSDVIFYNWEQIDPDTITGGIADGKKKTGPLFISVKPDMENNGDIRFLPKLEYLINNKVNDLRLKEVLPLTTRKLNFSFNVRDKNGGLNTQNIVINVDTTSEPFIITSPSIAVTWNGGSTQTVSWKVSKTNIPPIDCQFVDIYIIEETENYIFDFSQTPTLTNNNVNLFKIAQSVPNTGTAQIIIPDIDIKNGRLMIKASESQGIFFNISPKSIKIEPRPNSFELTTNTPSAHATPGGTFSYVIQIQAIANFSDTVHLELTDLDGFSYNFSPPGTHKAGDFVTLFISCPPSATPGEYNFLLTGESTIYGNKVRKHLPLSVTIPSYSFIDDKRINCIAQSKNGTIFAGTDEGIWRFTGVNFEQLTISGSLINKYLITDMAADTSGGIWVATRGRTGTSNPLTAAPAGRVFYFKNPAANPMTTADYVEWGSQAGNGGLQSRYSTSIDVDGNKIWTAHYYQTKVDGVTIDLPGGLSVLDYANPAPQPLFTPVTNGLPTIPSGNTCYFRNCDAVAARFGETWLVSRSSENGCNTLITNGIYRYQNGVFQHSWTPDSLSDPKAKALLTDAYPRAAYTDYFHNTWIGFNNNSAGSTARGLLVFPKDANTPFALSECYFPAGASVSRNAIWEDPLFPWVYVGTNLGLMIIDAREVESPGNYLFYNALENNQAIPAVRGGMVDKDGTLWLATDNGVIRTTLNYLRNTSGPPEVAGESYKLNIVNHNLSYKLTPNNDGYPIASIAKPGANIADTLFSVAADGSNTWFVVTGPNVLDMEIKIVGSPTDQDKFGYFEVLSASPDKKVFNYHHPKFLGNDVRSIGVEIRNPGSCTGALKFKFTVKFVSPPVLLLHGLWSDGEGCWKEMKEELIRRGYPSYMVNAPSYPNDRAFIDNIPLIPVFITNLLKGCGMNKVSAGKADLVGHSMGGIMSRLYLQAPKYKNDIHKIITIDTPHSGSQGANLILASPALAQQLLILGEMDPTNGAVADLRVNSVGIDVLLNGNRLNAHIVPSHAISSTKTVLEDISEFDCSFPPAWYLVPGLNSVLQDLSFSCTFTKLLLVTSPPGYTVDDFLKQVIFGGEGSDLVVAESSQKGGLSGTHTSDFYDLSHMEVQHNKSTIDWVYYLLRAKADAEEFAQDGFHPVPLDPVMPGQTDERSVLSGTVDITQPNPGTVYQAGAQVDVKVNSTGDVNKLVISMGNANIPIQIKTVYAAGATVSFTIPISALGRVNIVAAGYHDNQYVALDTTWINITTAAGLDSLKIDDGYNLIPVGHNLPIQIKGYFDDGTVRNVTMQAGMQFSSRMGRVSFNAPNLKGITVGADTILFTLSGKSVSLAVEVDSIDWINPDSTTAVHQPARPGGTFGKLLAFPNPFNEKLSLQISGSSDSFTSNVLIFNTLGQQVFAEKSVIIQGEQVIHCDLSKLPDGWYYVLLNTPSGPYTTKIIKHGSR